ncbi:cyclin-A3-1-like [Phoenix dactylifera]|uniref:Cyclin-A3-1-like n=1 Tax=Phoenix dactylifera TaxID=42345 RepID=A0A8B7BX38_PHODC|nr:cyclin-A3-1-like [Phoenix dactylifera]
MEDKENSVRLTRAAAARKRGASAAAPASQSLPHGQPPAKRRKRKALGELKNISNAASGLETPPPSKPRTRSRAKKQAEARKVPLLDASASEEVRFEAEDPQMCAFYAPDIYQYLRSMEVESKRRPLVNFIETVQKDVTANMRGILVDWLVEVAEEYKLFSDTLYLTVSYIDRFLSYNALSRQKLQLLGVSCMLIASKYEEISPPHVEDFCYITDNTYTKQEVVKMESDILKFLNFEMGNPTIKTFLRRFTKAGQGDGNYPNLQLEFLSNYLAELSLVDYGCVRFLPSVIAASAVFIARFTIDPKAHPWSLSLQQQTGYKPAELKDCVCAIHDLQLNRKWSSLTAIREKYKQHRFKCASMLLSPSEIPASYLEDLKE